LPGIDQEQLPKRAKALKAAKADDDTISSTMFLFGNGNPAGNGNRPHPVDTPGQHA
jgi:hypothetical protein